MKPFIIFVVSILFISCQSGDATPKIVENRAPSKFEVKPSNITNSKATISWGKAIDPDGDKVTYYIRQGISEVFSTISTIHTFEGLKQNTKYKGSVKASDGKGGVTEIPYSYTTKKKDVVVVENPTYKIPNSLKEYYKSIDFKKTGKELKDELAVLTINKHTNILTYKERHNYLYDADEDKNNTENVILIYSGGSRYWKEYAGNIYGVKPTFNTEHVYPRSKIKGTAITDLHHLRVCDAKINSKRGNYPYSEGSGMYKFKGSSWYPGDEWKGDVARMIMYINLRYNEPWNDVCNGGIDLLLKWNAEDPVSAIEIKRNTVIEKAQGNRNPFIDNPYLATVIWGGDKKAENRWQ